MTEYIASTSWQKALELLSEKKNQEYIYLQKVKPQNRQIFERLITDFDIKNSSLKILFNFQDEKEKLLEELKNLLIVREVHLSKIANLINSHDNIEICLNKIIA